MDKSSVKVNIYGSEYVIKGDDASDHIQAIADFVDQKMKEINKGGVIKSPLKVAILAALNISDEYFKTRADQKRQIDAMETKAQKLVELLNDIPSADSPGNSEAPKSPGSINLFSER